MRAVNATLTPRCSQKRIIAPWNRNATKGVSRLQKEHVESSSEGRRRADGEREREKKRRANASEIKPRHGKLCTRSTNRGEMEEEETAKSRRRYRVRERGFSSIFGPSPARIPGRDGARAQAETGRFFGALAIPWNLVPVARGPSIPRPGENSYLPANSQ